MNAFYVIFEWRSGDHPTKSWARYHVQAESPEQAMEMAKGEFQKRHQFIPTLVEVKEAY